MTTKPTDKPTEKSTNLNANEGEGSRTAGREYDAAATDYAKSGKVDDAAKQAREYVDQNPQDAADAERDGKRPLGANRSTDAGAQKQSQSQSQSPQAPTPKTQTTGKPEKQP